MEPNNQQAYDRGSTIFSPDGRLYQVEYAREAVARGGPTVGITAAESVVFASYGSARSPLVVPESIEKLRDIDGQLGIATAGHVADGRRLVEQGRQFAHQERLRYDEQPGVEATAKALADFVQESTQVGGTRPFGAALLVGGVVDRPRLYDVDPSGTPTEWRATAIGHESDAIREALEAEYEQQLDEHTALRLALRALSGDERELSTESLDVAVAREDGLTTFDEGQRRDLLEETEL
ncbi:proteasome alpha subunit [Halovenus aranensis]|uniref:Proteasome subunit alpha n=1 Tax=Halovenus aranensis TaxID=890420 RepID=A0A1G8USB6_9EURY|nr:archaeal proteasome endopeptidase complex subunit alpha [Halovenus aranensis]SDJ56698.1 proteasome alpha subunit [Halovenus aranensis]